jgi:hypothetical protein
VRSLCYALGACISRHPCAVLVLPPNTEHNALLGPLPAFCQALVQTRAPTVYHTQWWYCLCCSVLGVMLLTLQAPVTAWCFCVITARDLLCGFGYCPGSLVGGDMKLVVVCVCDWVGQPRGVREQQVVANSVFCWLCVKL